jgi:hypothetical protein
MGTDTLCRQMRCTHLDESLPLGSGPSFHGHHGFRRKVRDQSLPIGKHKFRIWHERAKILERSYEVEIKANETTEISLSYSEDKFNLVGIPYTNTETNSSQLRFTTGE